MKPDGPVLMITLQIPISADISANDVLQAIEKEVTQAIDEIRKKRSEEADEVEETLVTRSSTEPLEAYTSATEADQLAALGYREVE